MGDIDLLVIDAHALQQKLTDGTVNSKDLVQLHLDQIEKYNGYLRGVISTCPTDILLRHAEELDRKRAAGEVLGPLHGIPILIKDNIATDPSLGMATTCGSLALKESETNGNATIIGKLIDAGALILGKASLSEWAYFKGNGIPCGWSAVAGQGQSPYVRGGVRDDDRPGGHSTPGGSSSGSAISVAAGFAPLSVGSETCGSLVFPAERAALYTIKPSPGLVSQEGIIPISHTFDTAGPMAKTVRDEAALMDILLDQGTPIRSSFTDAAARGTRGGLQDLRIGVLPPEDWFFPNTDFVEYPPGTKEQMTREILAAYKELSNGARIFKDVKLMTYVEVTQGNTKNLWNCFSKDFKPDLDHYLATLKESSVRTLADVIQFNKDHADSELPPGKHNQERLESGITTTMTDDQYCELLDYFRRVCGDEGIKKLMEENDLDVILAPGDGELYSMAAGAGYPIATLPLGYLEYNGRPFSLNAVTTRYNDLKLVQLQAAWEASFPTREAPLLEQIVPKDSIGSAWR